MRIKNHRKRTTMSSPPLKLHSGAILALLCSGYIATPKKNPCSNYFFRSQPTLQKGSFFLDKNNRGKLYVVSTITLSLQYVFFNKQSALVSICAQKYIFFCFYKIERSFRSGLSSPGIWWSKWGYLGHPNKVMKIDILAFFIFAD